MTYFGKKKEYSMILIRSIERHTHTYIYIHTYANPYKCMYMHRRVVNNSQRRNYSFCCSHPIALMLPHVHCLTFSLFLTLVVFNVHDASNFEGHINILSLILYV